MKCTVHFIISLFNVGNVLLCETYQLTFTVFVYFTRISRYKTVYIVFGIIRGFTYPRLVLERIYLRILGSAFMHFVFSNIFFTTIVKYCDNVGKIHGVLINP